jgi:putative membrane protein
MDKARWTCDRRFPCKRRLVQRAFGLASSPMKRLTILALLIGAGLAAALILSSGVREVGGAVASVGWGIVPVVLVRVLTVELVGAAWALLFPADLRPRLRVCVLVRYVREGINTLLPLTAVGGEFIGARLLTFYRVEGALAAASVIVDMLVQAGTQFVFTAIGLVALIWLGGDETIVRISAIGLALAAPALAGFYVVQSRGGHRLVQSILTRFAGDREWLAIGGAVDTLYDRLQSFYGHRRELLNGAGLHFAAWLVGAVEIWIALRFMGYPVGFAEALVIESLAQAIRGAAFVVPGAIGVQEGGLIALGAVFGIPAEAALALSLIKRAADLAVGVPGLIAWQALEGKRLLRRREGAKPLVEKDHSAPS